MIELQRQLRDISDRLERLEKTDIGAVFSAYTPTYDGATPGSTTYTLQQGYYLRLGKLIIVTGSVIWSAASGTGNAQVTLPVAASSTSNQNFSGSIRTNAVTFAAGTPQLLLSASNAFFIMQSPATNAASTTVQVEAAGNLVFTVAYFID